MQVINSLKLKKFKRHLSDPLFKNSYFLMFNSLLVSFLGFLFWIVVARWYAPQDVGIATAIFSIVELIVSFSGWGLNFGLVRFLAEQGNKNEMINSSLTVAGLSSAVLLSIFFTYNYYLSQSPFVIPDSIYLLSISVLTIMFSIYTLQSNVFIAFRSAKLSLYQSIIYNIIRVPLPIFLVPFGVLGIVSSWTIAVLISFIISAFVLMPSLQSSYKPVPMINRQIICKIIPFSFGNYIAGILGSIPIMIMPMMIVNIMGPEAAAYFFMAWSCAAILSFIPIATTTSLFAEGSSNRRNFFYDLIKSVKLTFIILIPSSIFLILLNEEILMLFGNIYSENASDLLCILAISNIAYAINRIYMTVKRIEKNIRSVISINAMVAILMIIGSYILANAIGLIGVGIAWMISNGIVAIWIIAKIAKNNDLPKIISIFTKDVY